jgi:dihydropteroate synthase
MQVNKNNNLITLNCKGKVLAINKPIVMGIINATPDSFFEDSRKTSTYTAIEKAAQMINEGATIIDIGGQSTKPGSNPVSAEEEIERVVPIIKEIYRTFPAVFISIDTYYSSVAVAAAEAGACIVNDISGGLFDKEMIPTVGKLDVPYICMHIQGTPKTMQENPVYNNVTNDVLDYFIQRIAVCKEAGIKDVIVDVGFGFGKTIEHNYRLLKSLSAFKMLGKPLLVGVSRKGMIYKPLGITANEALNGTTVVNTIALQQGANILRVHDVKEAKEAIDLLALID